MTNRDLLQRVYQGVVYFQTVVSLRVYVYM